MLCVVVLWYQRMLGSLLQKVAGQAVKQRFKVWGGIASATPGPATST